MKAVGYQVPGSIDREDSLQDITLEKPKAAGKDLLVRVAAVSVNPVDTKLRIKVAPEAGGWKVLGFDAAGTVEELGEEVQGFKVGDEVYYAGSLDRPGTNSEYQLVDSRIVGYKPSSIGFAEAAALPLTSITAWEMLFDRLDVKRPTAEGGNLILVIGGAGGVASIAIQLLRALTDMTVIATASRPETLAWVRECGAHHVIDHSQPLAPQVAALGLGAPGFIFSTTQTDQHWPDILESIAPQGRFGLIDDPKTINIVQIKRKSLSIHFEYMFTRPVLVTQDMAEQAKILNEVAALIDTGKLRTTLSQVAGKIDAATLRKVHAQIESGTARGKIVLEGFTG
ncbi:zinc-binding alcohol dehydrogenase family protein [Treponema sp.]